MAQAQGRCQVRPYSSSLARIREKIAIRDHQPDISPKPVLIGETDPLDLPDIEDLLEEIRSTELEGKGAEP